MLDPIAIWGAITGTGALAFTAKREIEARRIRVRVDHGWRYLVTEDQPPQFDNLIVYVMVTNTGGRKVPVQHVGWEFYKTKGETLEDGTPLHYAFRAEIPLQEPVLLEPDGVPLKVEAWVGPLAHLVNPVEGAIRPVAFTGGGNERWEGPLGTLAQNIPPAFDRDKMLRRLDTLKAEAKLPREMGSPDLFYVEPLWAEGSTAEPVQSVSTEPGNFEPGAVYFKRFER